MTPKPHLNFLFKRPEIDHKKIALAGHSEGAETALTSLPKILESLRSCCWPEHPALLTA